MSILIKGMEMPESCEYCDFLTDDCCCIAMSGDEISEEAYDDIGNIKTGYIDPDCPLVEIPTPHRRLVEFIDVVTVKDEDSGTEEVKFGDVLKAYYEMREASTVIEAER